MAKDYTCWDCGYYGGRHEPTCPRKGYLNPSAPKAPPAAAPARVECACGIHREDCEYHRPAPRAPFEYGAFDLAAAEQDFALEMYAEAYGCTYRDATPPARSVPFEMEGEGVWSLCETSDWVTFNVYAQVWP